MARAGLAIAVALTVAGSAQPSGAAAQRLSPAMEAERRDLDAQPRFFPEENWPGPGHLGFALGYGLGLALRSPPRLAHSIYAGVPIGVGPDWLDLSIGVRLSFGGLIPGGGSDGFLFGGNLRLGVWIFSYFDALRNVTSWLNVYLGLNASAGVESTTSQPFFEPGPYVALQAFLVCLVAVRLDLTLGWHDLSGQAVVGTVSPPSTLGLSLVFYPVRHVEETLMDPERYAHGYNNNMCQ